MTACAHAGATGYPRHSRGAASRLQAHGAATRVWAPAGSALLRAGAEGLTLGLLPPMAPGRMEPVSWYLQRILETQPWDTRSWREMTQGLMPWWAISTILCRIWLGKGLPLINTPPS